MNDVREIRERSHQRKREPVARRLGDSDLVLHVVCQVSKRVTLLQATLFGVICSSRPVNETGWNAMNEIFFGFSRANRMIDPT